MNEITSRDADGSMSDEDRGSIMELLAGTLKNLKSKNVKIIMILLGSLRLGGVIKIVIMLMVV